MADLTITAANVLPAPGAVIVNGTLGVTATAGQSVYLNSDGTYHLALATSSTANLMTGILLSGGAAGQPCAVIVSGNYTVGATLTTGAIYILSGANAGGLAPVADNASTWIPVVAFIAVSTTVATMVNRSNSPRTAHS